MPRENRRRHPRNRIALAAEVRAGGTRYLGLIRDLSPGGAFIELLAKDPFPHDGSVRVHADALGEPIPCTLRHKRPDLIERGLVVGLGVEFETPSPALEDRVARVIDAAA